MKKPFILLIATALTLILASLACSIQNVQMQTIDTRVVNIDEPLPPDGGTAELVFQMTGGEFTIVPGADGLVNGSINYNVEQWEPEFTRSENHYEIKQADPFRITGLPSKDIINTWYLTLTRAIPLDLSIEGGASENEYDLSGLQLTNLRIVQGASDSVIRFDAPNPLSLENFTFTTGASSAEIYGLGYANFETMNMSSGAGDYTLDFGGGLSHDATVNIKSGISNITIIIPAGIQAVVVNEGTVSNINTRGTWLVQDNTYTTLDEGFVLTINLDMSVGNVTLVQGEQ